MQAISELISYVMQKPLLAIGLIAILLFWLLEEDASALTFSQVTVRAEDYAQSVLLWCALTFKEEYNNKPSIVFYKNRKTKDNRYGEYHGSTNEIRIFLNKNTTIQDITDTIIHEFAHAIQHAKDGLKNYDRYTRQYGYQKNPYEKEARALAEKYAPKCLKDLNYLYA